MSGNTDISSIEAILLFSGNFIDIYSQEVFSTISTVEDEFNNKAVITSKVWTTLSCFQY